MKVNEMLKNGIRYHKDERKNMKMNEAETWGLVNAMRKRVMYVRLGSDLTFDMDILCEYDGRGRCEWLQMGYDQWGYNYSFVKRDRLAQWGSKVGWVRKGIDAPRNTEKNRFGENTTDTK